MFKFWFYLSSLIFFTKYIDAGEGAGNNGEENYYDYLDIDDNSESLSDEQKNDNEELTSKQNQKPSSNKDEQKNDNDEVSTLKKQLEEQSKYIEEQKNIQAINEAIGDIKSRIPSFDENAVYNHLKELNKTNPQKAAMYNNPIGWENIWNEIKPDVKNDRVSFGRNTTPVDRDEEVFNLVKNGGASLKDEADVLGKLL